MMVQKDIQKARGFSGNIFISINCIIGKNIRQTSRHSVLLQVTLRVKWRYSTVLSVFHCLNQNGIGQHSKYLGCGNTTTILVKILFSSKEWTHGQLSQAYSYFGVQQIRRPDTQYKNRLTDHLLHYPMGAVTYTGTRLYIMCPLHFYLIAKLKHSSIYDCVLTHKYIDVRKT